MIRAAHELQQNSLPPKMFLQHSLWEGTMAYIIAEPYGCVSDTLMLVQIISDDPTIDVDLFGRYGSDVELDDGNLIADYDSESVTGNETITITRQSSPPLRPGVYYFSLALYPTTRTASGRIVVSFS